MLDQETKALLPTIISDAMASISASTNAPDELTLPVALAVATFATQGLSNAYPLAWSKCAISNYFCVLVPSGGMKTSIMESLLEGAKRFEQHQQPLAENAMTQYKIEMAAYAKAIKDQSVKPDGSRIDTPMYPRSWRYMASKFTLNGMIAVLKGVPHVGIFNSDAAEFFNSHSFSDANKAIEIVSAMSKLWSGEDLDKITGVEDVSTRGKRSTMLFMLQQQLAGFLKNPAFKDQGFTNRMLIAQCGMYPKPEVDFSEEGLRISRINDDRLVPFNDRVFELLSAVDSVQHKATGSLERLRNSLTRPNPNVLTLGQLKVSMTDGANLMLASFYKEMANAAMDDAYAEYSNFMSRAYEHACRLATVLALFDNKREVGLQEVACAIGLVRYFIAQRLALSVDGDTRVDPIVECSNEMVRLFAKWGLAEVSKSYLMQHGPSSYRAMSNANRLRVIEELEGREFIEVYEVEGKGNRKVAMVKISKTP